MSLDPYATTPSAYSAYTSPTNTQVDYVVIQALLGTRPWVRFCSVLGFIGTALILLAAVGMIIGGLITSSSSRGMATSGITFGMGFIYLIFGVLYFFPSLKLSRYASSITALTQSSSIHDLVAALEAQRSFWKFVGIMLCIVMALYAVMIVVFMFVGISAAGRFR